MKAIHWQDPRTMKKREDANKEREENKEQAYECGTD